MIIVLFAFFGTTTVAVLALLIHFSWTQQDLADDAEHAALMVASSEAERRARDTIANATTGERS